MVNIPKITTLYSFKNYKLHDVNYTAIGRQTRATTSISTIAPAAGTAIAGRTIKVILGNVSFYFISDDISDSETVQDRVYHLRHSIYVITVTTSLSLLNGAINYLAW